MPDQIPQIGRTVRIRFLQNRCYNGTDYGPDYPEQEADVRRDWAATFVAQGAAVRVEKPKPAVEKPAPSPTSTPAPPPVSSASKVSRGSARK